MRDRLFHRDFAMVVIGQIISIFGNVILRFALALYLLDLSGSALVFASITSLSMIPTILLSPLGGMMADRLSKRNIMVALDLTTAGLVLGFGLVLQEACAIPMIGAVMVLLAVIQSFYTPAVLSSVPVLQPPERLVRANAVVSQVNMVANLVGPVLGGMLYGFLGMGVIVAISGVCFFLSAVLEGFIHIPHVARTGSGSALQTACADLADSVRFLTREQPQIFRLMLTLGGYNLVYSALILAGLPFLLRVLLGMRSEWYGVSEGLIAAAGGVGALCAGLYADRLRPHTLYRMLLAMAGSLLPMAGCFMFGLSAGLSGWVIVACAMLSEMLSCMFSIVAMSTVQRHTPMHMLGRVTACVSTLCMCAIPLGQMLYGLLFDLLQDRVYLILTLGALASAALATITRNVLRCLETLPSGGSESVRAASTE